MISQSHDLGLHHSVDETREQFRLIRAEHVMARCQTFETNGELDVARANNVLNLEVGKLGVEAELLNDTGVLARGKLGVVLRLGTSDDHLTRCEDQSGSLGLANTHDDSCETLKDKEKFSQNQTKSEVGCHYLWVVLGVTCVKSNRLQIETAVKVNSCDNVP